jgi:hypothetical protein
VFSCLISGDDVEVIAGYIIGLLFAAHKNIAIAGAQSVIYSLLFPEKMYAHLCHFFLLIQLFPL